MTSWKIFGNLGGILIALVFGVSALILAFGWDGCFHTFDTYNSVKKKSSGASKKTEEKGSWVKPTADDIFGAAGPEIMEQMSAKNIEENLRYLTSTGHMAGTSQDLEQAEHLQRLWKQQGLDQAFLQPYNVQLSHPDANKPNKVYLLDKNGAVKFTSAIMEEPFEGEEPYPDSINPAFLAFAPSGIVTKRELVYANYGRYEDFEYLEKSGISVKDRIVIIRFGEIFRGDKVLNAERFNAAGVILYTDPSDYHPESETGGLAYPHSFWLPGKGIQRGSILIVDGDPTTPFYPAIAGAYRVSENDTNTPHIAAHCISYIDARKLITNMGGPEVPEHWKGGMHIKYRLGPHLTREGWKVKLEVNNVKQVITTYNVIGLIRGSEEPDRYVFIGNHRDSWVFGSSDPSSATAVQMEIVRVLGNMLNRGWRPRRSIVIGSWGAGEMGFFGATEYMEEFFKVFESRAVAHLNMDVAIIHNHNLDISATPLLHNIIREAAQVIFYKVVTIGHNKSWTDRKLSRRSHDHAISQIHQRVRHRRRYGCPSSMLVQIMKLTYDVWNGTDFPLYHTLYENFDAMKYLDPDFQYHLAIGRLWVLMALGLVDNKILPMDIRDEVAMHQVLIKTLEGNYGQLMEKNGISLEHLNDVVKRFAEVTEAFVQNIESLDGISPLKARQLNDQLMQLEKCYTDAQGLKQRPHMKNVVFGTDNFNQYRGVLAPGIHDAMWSASLCVNKCQETCQGQCEGSCSTTVCHTQWEEVKQQLSVLIYVINSATLMLKDVNSF
ncbi:unnamed protein product, partial [Meganyctiphanes norvegica]